MGCIRAGRTGCALLTFFSILSSPCHLFLTVIIMLACTSTLLSGETVLALYRAFSKARTDFVPHFIVSLISLTKLVTALPTFGNDYLLGPRELLVSSHADLRVRTTSATSNGSVSNFAKSAINSVAGIYVCGLDCADLWTVYTKCDLTNSTLVDSCLCNVDATNELLTPIGSSLLSQNDAWATCTSCIAVRQGNITAQLNYTGTTQNVYASGCGRALNYTTSALVATYTSSSSSSTPTSSKSASSTSMGKTSSAAASSVYMTEGRKLFSILSMVVVGLFVL
ncbi:BZ3500_MvSof-1268-A1-R1_Chr1-1g00907 [Microbotryum saponariae]|uniref:BZ3500_MvSof-1268-A1-R1_Chr1-1g00907 protein n=1 Tax=Microbotryum saponariae TaxID=289078 RepID=A0A2X0L0I1_9BASI|nr:BZ3500_MvSof-1268-A1-R1_Chr1-1g00907 [Microbotryum saponariae]SCZ92905.1 BZ3501_MvSof-1269-A2-R1_Chr1-1g00504 [Microbotryum saponariae]